MQRVKVLPLHSSLACRTLFREDLSTRSSGKIFHWLNEVSQRHISKSEIKTSTPTETQVSLTKSHSCDKARQTENLPVQYANHKKQGWAEFKECKVCKLIFYKTCWRVDYLCHSKAPISVPFALPLPPRVTPRCTAMPYRFLCWFCTPLLFAYSAS